MTTPASLHTQVLTLLHATTVTAYDGDVPDRPPADQSGRVYPYAVLWPGGGGNPADPALARHHGALTWEAQVTVAAGTPTWCIQAVDVVRAALRGVWLTTGASPLLDETPASQTLLRSEDTQPPRWYLPLRFVCGIA